MRKVLNDWEEVKLGVLLRQWVGLGFDDWRRNVLIPGLRESCLVLEVRPGGRWRDL